MDRGTLKELMNNVLDNNRECHINVDVWHPTIKEVKYLLDLGHDKIDPNNVTNSCDIFDLEFDKYTCNKAPGFRITLFCKDEVAEFMRKYYKEKGGE